MDTLWAANAVDGAPAYSGRALRQINAVLLGAASSDRPLGSLSGVRPGTSTDTVSATATTWTCKPFGGAADAETAAEAGPYTFAFDAVATGAIDAADSSSPRVDILYVQIDDPAESDGSTVPAATRGYLAGTPDANPVAPAHPTGRGFVIAEINVPKAGAGDPSVTWTAPIAVAAGGILPVDTLAELQNIIGYPGMHACVTNDPTTSNNGDYVWSGSTWTRTFYDTGWVDVSITAAGFTFPGQKPQAREKNGFIYMRGILLNSTFSGGYTTIGTLPEPITPPDSPNGATATAAQNTSRRASIRVFKNRDIQLYVSTTGSDWLSLSEVSWMRP